MVSEHVRAERRYFALKEVPHIFAPAPAGAELRVLLLADDQHPANVVQDHIRAICEYSNHHVTVVNTRQTAKPNEHFASNFDAVLIHYSIYVLSEAYLSKAWHEFISSFTGAVAVIHEDEYQQINAFKEKFAELGVRAVFSCLDSIDTLEQVYGGDILPSETLFFSCLPGYVSPQFLAIESPSIAERPFHVVYRGRTLPPELGRFAQEKRLIGDQMLGAARANGLTCDISSAEEDRIYGPKWPLFLMSGKATLGVEGGASIFDFDGGIRGAVESYRGANPDASFEDIWQNVLKEHEDNVCFRTITPKFFEAIATKTVLVLYPGNYRDVLIPDRHYIPLERNGSNLADVIAKLKDNDYLQEMADRTHDEILYKAELGSRFYVNQVDRVLWGLAKGPLLSRLLRSCHSLIQRQNEVEQEILSIQQNLGRLEQRSFKLELRLFELESMASNGLELVKLFLKLALSKIKRGMRWNK